MDLSFDVRHEQIVSVLQSVDVCPFVAVGIRRTETDRGMTDIVACQDGTIGIRTVVRREDVHNIVDLVFDRAGPELIGHLVVVREAGIFRKDRDLLLIGILIRTDRSDIDG